MQFACVPCLNKYYNFLNQIHQYLGIFQKVTDLEVILLVHMDSH